MSEPTYTCKACGNVVIVRPDGRGFPPDIARRKLQAWCKADGCVCDPQYQVGLDFGPFVRGMSG